MLSSNSKDTSVLKIIIATLIKHFQRFKTFLRLFCVEKNKKFKLMMYQHFLSRDDLKIQTAVHSQKIYEHEQNLSEAYSRPKYSTFNHLFIYIYIYIHTWGFGVIKKYKKAI